MQASRTLVCSAMRSLSRAAAPSVAARRTSFAPFGSTFRLMSINVNPYNPDTPGYEPEVGSRILKTCVLQKARTWDDAVADKFKVTTYDEIFENKKVVVFSVPGAFTGVCHKAHVPSYSKLIKDFKAKGVDSVICVSINDPYTMNAWQQALGSAADGIEFYADASGSFTHYMHREFDLKAAALGPSFRSNRYSMMVDNGFIKVLKTEKSPGDFTVSSGEEMLKEV